MVHHQVYTREFTVCGINIIMFSYKHLVPISFPGPNTCNSMNKQQVNQFTSGHQGNRLCWCVPCWVKCLFQICLCPVLHCTRYFFWFLKKNDHSKWIWKWLYLNYAVYRTYLWFLTIIMVGFNTWDSMILIKSMTTIYW